MPVKKLLGNKKSIIIPGMIIVAIVIIISTLTIEMDDTTNSVKENNTSKYLVETEDKYFDDIKDIKIEYEGEYSYTEEFLYNTIRSDIIHYSDVVNNVDELITEDMWVSVDLVNQVTGGTQYIKYEKVSNLDDNIKVKLIGSKTGDTFELEVEPTEYSDVDYVTTYKGTIVGVYEDPLKYFTDDWVKEYAQDQSLRTVEDYIKYVDEYLTNTVNTFNYQDKVAMILHELVQAYDVAVYDNKMLDMEKDYMLKSYGRELTVDERKDESNSVRLLKEFNNITTEEDYKKFTDECTKYNYKLHLIYDKIIEDNNLMPSDAELNALITEYMTRYSLSDGYLDFAKREVLDSIVKNYLVDSIDYVK